MKPIIGIDLGGTKIEGVILESRQNPNVLARKRIPTESNRGYQPVMNNIAALVKDLEDSTQLKFENIGIGTPGAKEPKTGLMKNCNTTCLNGNPLEEDLSKLLHKEVKIANDANCFAMAEYHLGVVKQSYPEAKVAFGVIMGTGVGGGLVIDGKTIHGLHGIGGEWGHIRLVENGNKCYCGKKGCVETYISGTFLESFYQKETGIKRRLNEIFDKSNLEKDEVAMKTKERLLDYYGLAMSYLINIVDPDIIVIGGGVGNVDFLYDEGREYILKYIFNKELNTPIVKPSLGESAGVFGAAFL